MTISGAAPARVVSPHRLPGRRPIAAVRTSVPTLPGSETAVRYRASGTQSQLRAVMGLKLLKRPIPHTHLVNCDSEFCRTALLVRAIRSSPEPYLKVLGFLFFATVAFELHSHVADIEFALQHSRYVREHPVVIGIV